MNSLWQTFFTRQLARSTGRQAGAQQALARARHGPGGSAGHGTFTGSRCSPAGGTLRYLPELSQ